MSDFGAGFGYFGDAIGDLFGAEGANQAAAGYTRAAQDEALSAKISTANGVIQKTAAQRSIEKAIGGQRSDIAGSGFEFTGTAVDLAADSAHQGAITQALIENQAQIETRSHESASQAYSDQAAQEKTKAKGDSIGGLLSIGLGIFSLFSDARLKHGITRIGRDTAGKNVYEFSYLGSNKRFRGYIAQELDPATVIDAVGFLSPDAAHRAKAI